MTKANSLREFDEKLDLMITRTVELRANQLWKCWTQPHLLKKWFCPLPWKTIECEIDLKAGGIFKTVTQSPDGHQITNVGSVLKVIENKELVWTNAITPGFRPSAALSEAENAFAFTVIIDLEELHQGTKYTARVLHSNSTDRDKHRAMGFEKGWGVALDQMIELIGQGVDRE
jgi:uncharacterized protein YndB with AHSA1/START domain